MGAVSIVAGTVKRGLVGTAHGRHKDVEADINLSASYATGGDTLTPQALGLRAITSISLVGTNFNTRKPVANAAAQAGMTLQLAGTETAPLVKAFDAANTEVANASNNSARGPFHVRFRGY